MMFERPLRPLLFLPVILLTVCDTGPINASRPITDRASLDGARYNVRYFLDNAPVATDVLYFTHDTLRSTTWEKAGFRTGTNGMRENGPGDFHVKATLVNDSSEQRRYSFQLTDAHVDGVVSRMKADGSYVTYTFSGERMR